MLDRVFTNEIGQLLENFRRTVDSVFDAYPVSARRVSGGSEQPEGYFVPAVETGWTKDDLNLRVILPGVSQEDVEVTAQGNQLFIRGERKAPEYAQNDGTFYSGLSYGKFERVITLPSGLQIDQMHAQLHNGVLDIWIPQSAEMKPKKIQITTAEPRHQLTATAA